MKRKLVVIFPGMGYHSDKPLLYFSKKIAKSKDYKIIDINYDFGYEVHTESKEKVFEDAMTISKSILDNINYEDYERVVFIGKSIGTVVAAKYNFENGIGAEMIIFTPVPQTFQYIDSEDCIIFHGSSDPLCATELVIEFCDGHSLTYAVIPDANHSLETGNVLIDIENIHKIMYSVDKVL